MINVNLLPPEIKEDIEQAKKNSKTVSLVWRIILMALLVPSLVVGMHFYFKEELKNVNQEAKVREEGTKVFGSLESDAKKVSERITAISNISKNINVWSGTIEEIQKIMPAGAYLTSFKYDSSSKTARGQISGQAISQKEVSALRDSMEQSKKFEFVDIDKSQIQTDSNTKKEGQAFTISFALEKDALK